MLAKKVFLAHFAGLCSAQREAMRYLRARQAPLSLGGHDQLMDTPVPEFDLLAPREPQITPAVSNDGSNVFTTVLYPSVPTAAPTANLVPIFVTYTGTLVASEVPVGFQWTAPASEPGTSAPTASQNIPTVIDTPSMKTILPAVILTPSLTLPTSEPTMSIPTNIMTSNSFSTTNLSSVITSTSSSTGSTTSSTSPTPPTPSSLITSSSSTTSTLTTASNTLSGVPTGVGLSKSNGAKETHKLSSGSIAGVIVGVISGAILFIALALFLWSRNKRSKRPESPGVYPEEAYLYDPPMTPPAGPDPGGNGGDIGLAFSSGEPGADREGLITGAVVPAGGTGGSSGAAATGRAGAESRPPQQWNGYSPIVSQDMAEFANPTARSIFTQAGPSSANPFTDPKYELGVGTTGEAASSDSHWPLNPNADSGLATPPGTVSASRPSTKPSTRRSTIRLLTPRSSETLPTVAGPSISGVGSPKYDRKLSANHPASPPSPSSNTQGEIIPSPYMRELRKAWGMDD
ncbi:hypothetical protein E6O75_ATG11581 [Venturia nashicola]|uniref:Uncharacterized protein n=1 Tax=Venturia nashicola TaxID=86259 RepID=A0A4Z1P410_9PEZI|nr:hypothetical protein E6O75_ATG11581 [Venturia nashicola]